MMSIAHHMLLRLLKSLPLALVPVKLMVVSLIFMVAIEIGYNCAAYSDE
jgi:hypothetical protein